MEKRLLIFLVLSIAVLYVWNQFFGPKPKPKPEPKPGAPAEAPAKPGEGEEKPAVTPEGGAEPTSVEPAPEETGPVAGLEVVPPGKGEPLVVDKARARWTFDSWGGSIRRVALKNYAREPDQDLSKEESWYPVLSPVGSDGTTPSRYRSMTLVLLDEDGRVIQHLDRVLWKLVERTDDRVVYGLSVPGAGLKLTKIFRFPKPKDDERLYHVDMELRVGVTDAEKAARFGDGLRFRLVGAGTMPREPFDLQTRVRGAAMAAGTVDVQEVGAPKKPTDPPEVWPEPGDREEGKLVAWAGLHTRFFTALLETMEPKRLGAKKAVFLPVKDRDQEKDEFTNLLAALEFTLPLPTAGVEESREFLFYAGPMDSAVLGQEPYRDFKGIIDYGFLGFIARFLVLLLTGIQAVVGNWGISIILLTLVVRLSLFPLSRKSQVSMQRYQKQMMRLKPKMDKIKERYANNKKKMQEETAKLFREEGVRMVPGGCLIMFLQFPVFIGLFSALRWSIGLRHSSFLWAADLTAPDRLLGPYAHHLPLLWNPFYLNVFPILMGVFWFLSSSMTPKAQDPQQQQTMKMMKWMPVVFSLMLYNYAAGLALYMVVSSLWSIFEMKVVRKILAKPEESAVVASPTFRKGR